MKLMRLYILSSIFLFGGFFKAQEIKTHEVQEIVTYLAADEQEGRDIGSQGIERSAEFIENKFKEYQIGPFFTTYRDTLTTINENTYNIVGFIEGTDVELNKEFVVIGGHYDHIGLQGYGEDKIANGANDNASGTATAMLIGKYLQKNKPKRSVIIALFSAEERGLLGSKSLAKKLKKQKVNVVEVFNFEMNGVPMKEERNSVYITGYDKSNIASVFNTYFEKYKAVQLELAKHYQLFSRSDNYPFYKQYHIPAHTFSTFDFENYEYYHHVKDESLLMDFESMEVFIADFSKTISKIINSDESLIKLN